MSKHIANAVEQLRAEEIEKSSRLDELRRQVRQVETELRQIQQALSALNEKPRSKTAPRKQAASVKEVCQSIAQIVVGEGSLREDELKKAVRKKLVAAGKSLRGYDRHFQDALADDDFERSVDGVVTYRG